MQTHLEVINGIQIPSSPKRQKQKLGITNIPLKPPRTKVTPKKQNILRATSKTIPIDTPLKDYDELV